MKKSYDEMRRYYGRYYYKKNISRVQLSSHQGSTVVRESLEWYRDRYKHISVSLLVSLTTNILLIILLVVVFLLKEKPKYFSVTPDLRIQQLVALSEPYIKNEELGNWVAQKVSSTLSLNFLNWVDKLGEVRSAYDEEAFKSLVSAMRSNGILSIIEEKRLVCSAIIPRAPIIHASGINRGVFTWRLKMPVVISYESSRGVEYTQKLTADILIQRVSTLKNPVGISIKQIVLAQEK